LPSRYQSPRAGCETLSIMASQSCSHLTATCDPYEL